MQEVRVQLVTEIAQASGGTVAPQALTKKKKRAPESLAQAIPLLADSLRSEVLRDIIAQRCGV